MTNENPEPPKEGGESQAVKKRKARKGNPVSLVTPAGMGGIIGGGGYDFQKRYITCRMVEWLQDPAFQQLLHEGLGDVDVRFRSDTKEWREHIQVKDHEVSNAEIKEVLAKFVELDHSHPDLYLRFTLASLSLSADLKRLNRILERREGASSFFDTATQPLEATDVAIRTLIGHLGLAVYEEFIFKKLKFDSDLHNYHHDEKACTAFIGALLRQEGFREKFRQIAEPAYTQLLREVESRRGKVFDRSEIETLLEGMASQLVSAPTKPVLALAIHNWSTGKFDISLDHELDWCSYFDRPTRRVPPPDIWTHTLLPQIRALEKEFLAEKGAGLLRFRGFCCLTTGIAVGNIFREVSGWSIEMHQAQTNAYWSSDAEPALDYTIAIHERVLNDAGDSIAVLLNVKGDGVQDVLEYLEETGATVKVLVTMEPPESAGSLSIKSDREAVAFANQARDAVQRIRKQHRTRTVHLFFYGPQALAVFLGQRLTAIGRVNLYEFQDPSYVFSCSLLT